MLGFEQIGSFRTLCIILKVSRMVFFGTNQGHPGSYFTGSSEWFRICTKVWDISYNTTRDTYMSVHPSTIDLHLHISAYILKCPNDCERYRRSNHIFDTAPNDLRSYCTWFVGLLRVQEMMRQIVKSARHSIGLDDGLSNHKSSKRRRKRNSFHCIKLVAYQVCQKLMNMSSINEFARPL